MPDNIVIVCPDCGMAMTKAAVCKGAFPVCVGHYEDIDKGRYVDREIEIYNKTWLDAYVCPDCGTVKLKAHNPDVFKETDE